MSATRWGIVSAGHISHDFVKAVQLLPASDHQVVAIAARDLDKAKEFANKFNIPRAYGSYEELSKDPDVDVVYVGTVHIRHVEVSKLMLNAGKPVLCEKPLSVNLRSTQDLLQTAKDKKLFLMEAFWTRFFPAYAKIRQTIKDGSIGEPTVLTVNFGAALSHNERNFNPALGGGAMLDVGCYPVTIADMIFGGQPEKIVASSTIQDTGVDESTVVVLTYPGNRMAVLTCSQKVSLKNNLVISGDKGIIEIHDCFWSPSDVTINGESHHFDYPGDPKPYNFVNSCGLAYEAQHVRECLLKGDLESPIMPHESSLNIARIMEEALRQAGISYDTLV